MHVLRGRRGRRGALILKIFTFLVAKQARSQAVFSGKPGMISRDHFVCPVPSFSEMKEIGGRKVLGFQKNW